MELDGVEAPPSPEETKKKEQSKWALLLLVVPHVFVLCQGPNGFPLNNGSRIFKRAERHVHQTYPGRERRAAV